jgi:hypothetical protein
LVFLLRSSGVVVVVISLLAILFTNLVLDPVQERGMTPVKSFSSRVFPSSLRFEPDTISWNIIPVSKIFVLQMCLFRTVTACRWQVFFDNFERSELHDAIHVKALWDNESGMSLASH